MDQGSWDRQLSLKNQSLTNRGGKEETILRVDGEAGKLIFPFPDFP